MFKVYNEFFDKFKILRVEYFSFLVYLFNMVLYNLLLERFNIFSDFNGFRVKVDILKILYLFRVKFFKVRFFIGWKKLLEREYNGFFDIIRDWIEVGRLFGILLRFL